MRESNRIEGINREPLVNEIDAHKKFIALHKINVHDLEDFVQQICGALIRSSIGMDVSVGDYIPPRGGVSIITGLTNILWAVNIDKCDIYKAHIAYQRLHPFMDGNGRSGRVLWLWYMDGVAPLGFLHKFYYQALDAADNKR